MYKEFEKSCILLAESIIFKVDILPKTINNILISKGYEVGTNPRYWKYYLNLNGEKHISNNDVKIIALEDGNEYSLTKEFLEQKTLTKESLKSDSIYYQELLDKYPSDAEYILGCLYPIDFDTAYNAQDGDILSYNNLLIERQELNIISSLEAYIKKILHRWKYDKFTRYEELYIHSFLAIVYLNLPSIIINTRLKNINTPYVHSYFMELYFRSNDIGPEVDYLNKQSKFWLYRNLDYIKHNIGKDKTLHKVIENIFNTNNIGIAKVNLGHRVGTIDGTPSKDSELVAVPYNDIYNDGEGLIKEDILNKEITTRRSNILKENIDVVKLVNENLESIDRSTSTEDSKIVYIQTKNSYNFYPNKLEAIVSHWAYMLNKGIINIFKEFQDPNNGLTIVNGIKVGTLREYIDPITKITYRLNSYTAFLVLLKLLLHLDDRKDELIKDINYNGIINKDFNLEDLNLYDDGFSRKIISKIHNDIPDMPIVINREIEFKEYLERYFKFKQDLWTYVSNVQNSSITGNIKTYCNFIETEGSYNIGDGTKTIHQILLDNEIDYKIGKDYDLILSIQSLVGVFTTFIDDNKYYQEEADAYKLILKKLSSYTIQPLNQTHSDSSINLFDNNPTIFNTENPIITILGIDVDSLEDIELELESYLDDFISLLYDYYINTYCKMYGMRDICGGSGIYKEHTIIRNLPINFITVQEVDDYDVLNEEWKDEFIHNVKIQVLPLEVEVEIDSELTDDHGVTHVDIQPHGVTVSSAVPITGGYSNVRATSDYIKPINIISIMEDDVVFDILTEDFNSIIYKLRPNDAELFTYTHYDMKYKMSFMVDKPII